MSTESEEKNEEQHPLQNDWVLWEHRAAGQGNKNSNQWKENMNELAHFRTVEEFWMNFNHIPKPSEIFFDGDCRKKVGQHEQKTIEEFSLFKKGIEPEWGDPKNVTGGEWFCRQYFEPDVLDLYWSNLVMACVGETIEVAANAPQSSSSEAENDDATAATVPMQDHINGARVVDKSRGYPLYKLEVWIGTRDPVVKENIRTKLLEIITDGQLSNKKTTFPKFDWKDHSP